MIKIFLLFILPVSLFASKILSYNIYDRTDRVDVMITFDTPYDGVIRQSLSDTTITIKLENASIESSKVKQLSSKYIKSITITPIKNYTQIVAVVPPSIHLQASKTSDSYGLRLRFATKQAAADTNKASKNNNTSLLNSLPTKKESDISQSYYIVITILIIGILALLYIKKRFTPKQNTSKESPSWLFKDNKNIEKKETNQQNLNSVSIRFQKALNSENSVVMLDFAEQSYLVLMGKSNIMLDKFTDNKPVTEDDFNSILQSRHKELDSFLNNNEETTKEYFETYREKAASMLYEP